ncbi:uncharacterized protein [Drosophila kikkawai]|uniref:Uncharacterized protein n=1 Tax=Drosophila kikkawai TaxID=30033 RepID=A0A6P4JM60_DROKI|nr:uncharacterized protein LOC108084196 [Drosophila kikkawai]
MSKLAELKRQYDERWHYPPPMPTGKVTDISCGAEPVFCGDKAIYGHNERPVYKACWEHPIAMPLQTQLGVCWEYPPERYKRRPLPPPCRGSSIPLHLLEPTFEHCKNLYTRGDFQLEQCVHQQLLVLDEKLGHLTRVLAQARPLQIQKVKEMRYHGVRYRLLAVNTACTKLYPEYLSRMTEERALCEFQRAYNEVNESNTELMAAFLDMRVSMPELEVRLSRLDKSLKSPFQLELEPVMQAIEDLNTYFFGVVVKMKSWAELMDPMKEHSVEDYLALLTKQSNFNDFMSSGMENCTCKRGDKKDPLKPYLPCWCQHSNPCEIHTNAKEFGAFPKICDHKESSDTSMLEKAVEAQRQRQ